MGEGTSILTNGQRDYLNGDNEPTQERTVKARIRQRLRTALWDISLLLDEFGTDEIKKTFDDKTVFASDLVALAILAEEFSADVGMGKLEYDPERGHKLADGPDEPETTIVGGVRRAYEKLGVSLETVEVIIEQGRPLDELAGEELAELSDDELGQLFQSGRITRKQMSDALHEKDVRRHQDDAGGE